jgi:hypothetical protein
MHQDSILIFTLNKTFNVAEMLPNMSIIEMFEGEEYSTYAVKLA